MGLFFKMMVEQDWRYLLPILYHILPCTLLIMVYGVVTAKVSLHLGDPTPQLNGGTKFHPLEQVEPIGLLLFVTSGIGWGRFFPRKQENFKNIKEDSLKLLFFPSLLFLALSFFSLLLGSVLHSILVNHTTQASATIAMVCIWLCVDFSILSLSFSLFQLLPIPNSPCFFTLFPSLPQSMQKKIETYHAHLTLLFITILWSGSLHPLLFSLFSRILSPICTLLGFPFPWISFYFL